jgi:hypothetical protein
MHSSSWLAPCLLVFSLHAQAPAGAPDPQAVASAGDVHAITLDVEVTDKKGAPIAGLKAGDFTLLDNRQPQTITSIDSVTPATQTPDASRRAALAGRHAVKTFDSGECSRVRRFPNYRPDFRRRRWAIDDIESRADSPQSEP